MDTLFKKRLLFWISPRHVVRRSLLPGFAVVLVMLAPGCQEPVGSVEEHLSRGEEALSVYDFKSAYKDFAAAYPQISESDPVWPRATYVLGLAAWNMTPPTDAFQQEAIGHFERLIKKVDAPGMVHRSLLNLARIHEVRDFPGDAVDVGKAREYYRRVIEGDGGADLTARAVARMAQTYVDEITTEGIKKAVDLLEEFLSEASPDSFTVPLWQYLGELYGFELDNPGAALRSFLHAEAIGFANESKADLYLWRMAQWADAAGDVDSSIRLYQKIVRDEPRSNYRSTSRHRLVALAERFPEREITIPDLSPYGSF